MGQSQFFQWVLVGLVLMFNLSCENQSQQQADRLRENQSRQTITLDKNFKTVMGQTIYVPIYSYIYHGDDRQLYNLTATLSVRNTDLMHSIVVTAVRYHDSDGKLVKQYLDRPIQLSALAATDFVIDSSDTSGGLGASFIVEWIADQEVSQPIAEAILISTAFQQGISFVSPGRVIRNHTNRKPLSAVTGS